MDSGFYAACTALAARSQALESVANNLANASTTGYRAQKNTFRSVVLESGSPVAASRLNQAVNEYGVLGEERIDTSQGVLESTGSDLDLGIEGDAFFVINTPAGRMLTRNGNFHLATDGRLVTSQGDPVNGIDGPIKIVGGGPVSISADGTISVQGAIAGKLQLVTVASGTTLTPVGNTYYMAPEASQLPGHSATVHQGMLESSNVNAVASAVEVIAVQRLAELSQRILSMFHTEFNRVATEELPRVNS